MVIRSSRVYSKKSTIPGIGQGLFAKVPIKTGCIIAEFKGRHRGPNEKVTNNRSNIYFHDESILECGPNDLASFSNDPIIFPKIKLENRRQLMASLRSNEPFYKINPNCTINAHIKINNDLYRAFLVADCDIKQDEEIFNHYGFAYWFQTELTKLGFLEEEEIEQNGFPAKIFEYPAFMSYIRMVYPDYASHEIKPFGEDYDFIITFTDGKYLVVYLKDYSKVISKRKIGHRDDPLSNANIL